MALGAALGSFNGLLIASGGVPPIIATLGTLSIYRGLVFFYSQGTWINAFEMPPSFRQLAKGTPPAVEDAGVGADEQLLAHGQRSVSALAFARSTGLAR